MKNNEIKTYEQKAMYYSTKRELLEERIKIIHENLVNTEAEMAPIDRNKMKLDLLELESQLDGCERYWKHYSERMKAIKANEVMQTQECEQNFDSHLSQVENMNPKTLSQNAKLLRENILQAVKEMGENHDAKLTIFAMMKGLIKSTGK